MKPEPVEVRGITGDSIRAEIYEGTTIKLTFLSDDGWGSVYLPRKEADQLRDWIARGVSFLWNPSDITPKEKS